MREHPDDPRIAVIDNIADGRKLRRSWLGNLFSSRASFQAAIHSSPQLAEISSLGEKIMPFLTNIFSADTNEISHSLFVEAENGRFHPLDIVWKAQYKDRNLRENNKLGSRPAMHHFGMSEDFSAVIQILSDYGQYIRPLTGTRAGLFLSSRTRLDDELHRDGRPNDPIPDYRVTTMPLGHDLPSTIIETENGTIIRPPNGVMVSVNDTIRHGTPKSDKFRPVVGSQPSALSGDRLDYGLRPAC